MSEKRSREERGDEVTTERGTLPFRSKTAAERGLDTGGLGSRSNVPGPQPPLTARSRCDSGLEVARAEQAPMDVPTELRLAGALFRKAVAADAGLAKLVFIDPIRAYADAGILLSKSARRFICDRTPGLLSGSGQFYDDVRDGKVSMPGLQYIRVSEKSSDAHDEGEG